MASRPSIFSSHFGEPLPPPRHADFFAIQFVEAGRGRRAGTDFGQWPRPPFLDDARPFEGFHHSFRFRQWAREMPITIAHPRLKPSSIYESVLSPPTSFLYLFSASSQSKKRNTSRAANNEQSVPPTTPNRCRRDVEHGDRADAQEGQRPEARPSSYQNCYPLSFSYSETICSCCCFGSSAGPLRRLHPRRRPHPVPPLGPAAADRPGAPAAQCD